MAESLKLVKIIKLSKQKNDKCTITKKILIRVWHKSSIIRVEKKQKVKIK